MTKILQGIGSKKARFYRAFLAMHLNHRPHLERVTGIEPACSAWEADALPLSYTRTHSVVLRIITQEILFFNGVIRFFLQNVFTKGDKVSRLLLDVTTSPIQVHYITNAVN